MDIGHEMAGPRSVGLPLPTGAMIAALYAAVAGLLTLAFVNIAADVDGGFRAWLTLHNGIGPYSGKVVLMLVAWAVAWPVLHVVLRRREVPVRRWFGGFLILLLAATVLVWPPVFGAIADALGGG
ncbi:MAG: hypothetical protein ACT4OI_10955 [Methanobacteriota archaeon]